VIYFTLSKIFILCLASWSARLTKTATRFLFRVQALRAILAKLGPASADRRPTRADTKQTREMRPRGAGRHEFISPAAGTSASALRSGSI
jgi:hypothetical protein